MLFGLDGAEVVGLHFALEEALAFHPEHFRMRRQFAARSIRIHDIRVNGR